MESVDLIQAGRSLLEMEERLYTRHIPVMPPEFYHRPIVTKQDLRKLSVDLTKPYIETSGSTGEPLRFNKTYAQIQMYHITNNRELLWRRWDPSLKMAVVIPSCTAPGVKPWHVLPNVFPNKKGGTLHGYPANWNLDQIQCWVDQCGCDYLFTLPSLAEQLDTSSFLDVKTTGERGGTMYSANEIGTIGISCPDNPDVYHIMENIFLEIDKDDNILITDFCNPAITRYMLGDKGEWATCTCGRRLQTISRHVLGRIRNMALRFNGQRFWPTCGIRELIDKVPTITQAQYVQLTREHVVVKVVGAYTPEEEEIIKEVTQRNLGQEYTILVESVTGFPKGKFEEFLCLVSEEKKQ